MTRPTLTTATSPKDADETTILDSIANRKKLIDMINEHASAHDTHDLGAFATGTITCIAKASMADTDFCTIGDGLTPAKLYEFDTAGNGVTAGRVQVNISGSTTAQDVATVLATAIMANQPALNAVATAGVVTITHLIKGVVGNVTITENVANAGFLVTGMAGGHA